MSFASEVGRPVPIVVLVFDGLPLYFLMDRDGSIDERLFPNFQRLADTSTWFRDATTVADSTVQAMTAILTGRYPDVTYQRAAVFHDYPVNLLTVLPDEYQKNVFERHTLFSPRSSADRGSLPPLIQENLLDLALIYLHGAMPASITGRLPAVDQTWRGFWLGAESTEETRESDNPDESFRRWVREETASYTHDRSDQYLEFLDALSPQQGLYFHYYKSKLPHRPWEYLPSGRSYKGYRDAPVDNEASQGFQRHLLQSMYVDVQLGQLLDRLDASEWGDQALVLVTADHGVSFKKGRQSRRPTGKSVGEVLPIPLFLKLPGQAEGTIVEGLTETVDILPTILSVLEITVPTEFDGVDALANRGRQSAYHFIDNEQPIRNVQEFTYSRLLETRRRAIKRKLDLVGNRRDPWGLYRIGPNPAVVGRQLSELRTDGSCESRAVLDDMAGLEDVDLDGRVVPTLLVGKIAPGNTAADLAVAVNGTIAATASTFADPAGNPVFSMMIPELLLQSGRNAVLLLEFDAGDAERLGRCAAPGA